jgi:hypothetical protein
MACTIDESSLPILTGCPGSGELIVVENAVGGLDANGMFTVGYARRYISDLITCFLNNLVFVPLQFTIGQLGSPMTAGQTVLVINQANLIQDSVNVVLGGVVLDRNDDSQVSYVPVYGSNDVTLTFNEPAETGQVYVINYAYAN